MRKLLNSFSKNVELVSKILIALQFSTEKQKYYDFKNDTKILVLQIKIDNNRRE